MPYCSSCGSKIEGDNVRFCPSCGAAIISGDKTISPPPPTYSGSPYPYWQYNQQPVYGDADRTAIHKLTIFSVILLVAILVSILIGVGLDFFLFSTFSGKSLSSFSSSSLTNYLYLAGITAFVGMVIEVASLAQLHSALGKLAGVDRFKFGTPSTLTLLLIIALPLAIVGVIGEFAALVPFFNSISSSSGTSVFSFPSYFFIFVLIEVVAGLAPLVGYIGGLVLGVWRVGVRYDESMLKVAAILFIIPFIAIVAPILIFIGVRDARRKVESFPTRQP